MQRFALQISSVFTIVTALFFIADTARSGARAEPIKLKGNYSQSYIEARCLGTSDGKITTDGNGGYGCKTSKGEVNCDKNGHCTGNCGNCGGKSASSGKGGVGGILTGGSPPKTQPLRPQQTTTSPSRTPTRPLTQQNVARSPKTAPMQPLTTQKTTASPKTVSSQSMNASPSSRRNGR